MNPVLTTDPASGDCMLFDVEPISNKLMFFVRYFFIMALIVIFLMAGKSEGGEMASDDPVDKYNVVWTTPSENHNGSMPIGNGETGLNLWVEPSGDLVLLISRTDSWDENERLCKLGRVRIKFNPRLADGTFKQELKLRQGEIHIVGGPEGKSVTARIWVDAKWQVIHVDADSESAFETQVDLDLWRKQMQTADNIGDGMDGFKGPKTIYPDTIVGEQKNRIVW